MLYIKKIVDGIFCDLKKAFDSIERYISLSKLDFKGIRSKFKEFLPHKQVPKSDSNK